MVLSKTAVDIVKEGVEEVKPKNFLKKYVSYNEGILNVCGNRFKGNKIAVIGGGKASGFMAKELENIIGDSIETGEINTNNLVSCKNINLNSAEHPYPGKNSVKGTKKMLKLKNSNCDLVIALISGGGSSMIELPKDISLEDLKEKEKELILSGKGIDDINEIRSRFSYVKDGGLAKNFFPKKVVGLVLSDVMSNDIKSIASGPTCYDNANNFILADNDEALNGIEKSAIKKGFSVDIIKEKIMGDPSLAVKKICSYAKNVRVNKRAIVFGGETTPKVDKNGKGGRNQHLAVSFLKEFKNEDYNWCFLSFASDGKDFINGVGGAFVCNYMNKDNIDFALDSFNSFDFLEKRKGIVFSEGTGTNVGDLGILLMVKK
ncbi:MAG: DUF4147 domain-containing protein [Nanobdellota archaeon]